MLDLFELGDLWQARRIAKLAVVHRLGLAVAVPADLLHAVIELVLVSVGIERIRMPVRAGHVAPGALDLDIIFLKPADRAADLREAPHLPGDLVDRHARLLAPAERVTHTLGKE